MELTVYKTEDYGTFKRLLGNRGVAKSRVKAIKDSIKKVGYISNPIICNEKLEVIDGQGRLEALKELGIPVEYRIVEGIGIDECRAMNQKPTAWRTSDVVKSYAESGNQNYKTLIQLAESLDIPVAAMYNLIKRNVGSSANGTAAKLIKEGRVEINDYEKQETLRNIEILREFDDVRSKAKMRKAPFYCCLLFCLESDGCEYKRMKKNLNKHWEVFSGTDNVLRLLGEFSDVYNKGCPGDKMMQFDFLYKKSRRRK